MSWFWVWNWSQCMLSQVLNLDLRVGKDLDAKSLMTMATTTTTMITMETIMIIMTMEMDTTMVTQIPMHQTTMMLP